MMPINFYSAHCGTVQFWQSARKPYGARTWKGAMQRFAAQHGKAIAMLADDSAIIIERQESGALIRHELPAENVYWHNGHAPLPKGL